MSKISYLANLIAKIFNKKVKLYKTKLLKGSPNKRCPDIKKIKKLGFKQKISLTQGLNKIILNDTITSFSHDEFGYYLLKDITPRYIYIGTRFHSCPDLLINKDLSQEDIIDLNITRNFYEYDHDTKSPYWCPIDQNILNECINLIDKHFPEEYDF